MHPYRLGSLNALTTRCSGMDNAGEKNTGVPLELRQSQAVIPLTSYAPAERRSDAQNQLPTKLKRTSIIYGSASFSRFSR